LDIVIWFEDGDDGEVIAVAVNQRGRDALTHVLYSTTPVYSVALHGGPEEFLESVGQNVKVVLNDNGHMINMDTDKKVLQ